MSEIKVGQIWQEVDPRQQRFVRIESTLMRDAVSIRTVTLRDGTWTDAPRSRVSHPSRARFSGKRGGYKLHQDVTP